MLRGERCFSEAAEFEFLLISIGQCAGRQHADDWWVRMNKGRWALVVAVCSVSVVAFVVYRATAAKSRSFSLSNSAAENRNSDSGSHAAVPSVPLEISQRGPGMRPQSLDALKFPVPRTLDLTYVTAANFATALGDDPLRIFNYVRDEISFESYTGCLRGPRGTLLALAGNSVDRSSLLASMLQHGGQRVRFAHGTLPEPLARELVSSMWADRPQPPADTNSPDAAKAGVERFVNSVQRDYKLIRDQMQKANVAFSSQSVPSLDSLIKETQDHYWIQWLKDGNWVDLDPLFSDSTPTTKYATATETLDSLPNGLYHQVEIRVRIEEYAGNQPSSRVILTRNSKAADLSGVTVLLAHEPENWNGPAENLQAALTSAIQDTGRIRPVLFLGGENWAAGAPFYPKSPPASGMGGIFNGLAGIGTRHDAPIASAEALDIDLISPNGQKETITRNIFDVVGPARRAKNINLSYDDLRTKADANDVVDLSASVYALFFSTGAIAEQHVLSTVAAPPTDEPDAERTLQRIAVTFTVMSDAATSKIGAPGNAATCFYFDSPRLTVIDVSKSFSGEVGFTLDLRRDSPRAVALAGCGKRDVAT